MTTHTAGYTTNTTFTAPSTLLGGQVTCECIGARGNGDQGGYGAVVIGVIQLAPGATINVNAIMHVGGLGNPGNTLSQSGGCSAAVVVGGVLAMEAGAGGAGQSSNACSGGAGGQPGGDALYNGLTGFVQSGKGANGATPGAGGTGTTGNGSAGTFGGAAGTTNGGAGETAASQSFGGGGGYAGGGGGGDDASIHSGGGGGGSSYYNPALVGSASIVGGQNGAYLSEVLVTYRYADAPAAPALLSPASGADVDAAAGFTVQFTYEPGADSGAMKTWAMRRKTSGAYSYYNAATQSWSSSSRVENSPTYLTLISGTPGATTCTYSYTFPAGLWTDGNTYSWSVATVESFYPAINIGAFASDFSLVAVTAPTATFTSPGAFIVNQTVSVAWTHVLSTAAQIAYVLNLFSDAQVNALGFDPNVTPPMWQGTGTSATSLTIPSTGPVPSLLSGQIYHLYLMITETGGLSSVWETTAFGVILPGPAQPTCTATPGFDGATGQPIVTLACSITNNSIVATSFVVQYSDDGGTTWLTHPRMGGAIGGTTATYIDYETQPGITRSYRVGGNGFNSTYNQNVTGTWSTTQTAQTTTNGLVYISDPLVPHSAIACTLDSDWAPIIHEEMARYFPVGRDFGIKATDGTKGIGGTVVLATTTTTLRQALQRLLLGTQTYWLQLPSEGYYISTNGDRTGAVVRTVMGLPGNSKSAYSIPYVQAAQP